MTMQYIRNDKTDPTNGMHLKNVMNNAKFPYKIMVLIDVTKSIDICCSGA